MIRVSVYIGFTAYKWCYWIV